MSSGKLLRIEPRTLKFPKEIRGQLRKPITRSIKLYNRSNEYVGFKVKHGERTRPNKYVIQPPQGVLLPRSTSNVIITMQGHPEKNPDMECEDELVFRSVIIYQTKDVSLQTSRCRAFLDASNIVDVAILRVVYVSPWPSPSLVHEVCDGVPVCAVEPRKHIASPIELYNKTNEHIAFKASRLNEFQEKSARKTGDSKENPLKVESDEDEECYEIDPIIFTRKLTFNDNDDVALVAEKGPVALRDFPHPRHLCGCFPFKTTSHESCCIKCFCCVCEVAAPCLSWEGVDGHCHLTKKIR